MKSGLSPRFGLLVACALAVTLLPAAALADTLAAQGALVTAGGGPVPDGLYGMQVVLYADAEGKVVTFSEKLIAVPVNGGLFEVVLGADPATPLDGPAVAAAAGWIGVKINIDPELPLVRLRPVLRAWRASVADMADEAEHAMKADFATGANSANAAAFADSAKTADYAATAGNAATADHATEADTAKKADVATSADDATTAGVAQKLQCTGCVGKDQIDPTAFAPVAWSGKYADLEGGPDLSAYARLDKPNTFASEQTFGAGVDLGFTGSKGLRLQSADAPPTPCEAGTTGAIWFDTGANLLWVCNGKKYLKFTPSGDLGTEDNPAASCLALKKAVPATSSGLAWIDFDAGGAAPAVSTWCDMVTDGGGWTLVTYTYRLAGNKAPGYLPIAANGSWKPDARDNIASINAASLVGSSTHVALSVTDNALVKGDLTAYAQAFVWNIPNPSVAVMALADPAPTSCVSVSVKELKANKTFSAYTLSGHPLQVSCAGHKAATPYERQFLGFNANACWGVCGSDPVNSMGLVVWSGNGYNPVNSGGKKDPERPASMAFWMR